MRRWRRYLRTRNSQRLGAALAIAVFCGGAIGLPIPVPRPHGKSNGSPFPCQDHPCGCMSAEQCWQACCCFSPEQRLAWAQSHHVDPPESLTRQCSVNSGHCDADHRASAACCSKGHGSCDATPHRGRFQVVIVSLARQCQGLATIWATVTATLPPARVRCEFKLQAIEWLATHHVCGPITYSPPPVPPPRVASC